MPLHAPARPRRSLVFLTTAALGAAIAVSGLAPTLQAHAESGRRICRYVWIQNMGNPDGREVSFVVDYKKDGPCPNVDPHRVSIPKQVGMWMPPPDTWEQARVPKMTCEELQGMLHLPNSGRGLDPCNYMENDRFYAVTTALPDDNGQTQRLWDLGSVWDLKY